MRFATFNDEQLHRLPVLMLRALCRVSELEQSGRKAALVDRLCEESIGIEAGHYYVCVCVCVCVLGVCVRVCVF